MEQKHAPCFPERPGAGYENNYKELAAYLDQHVHTEVERGALLADIGNGTITYEHAVYLNNHGPNHVKCAIDRASDLLRELNLKLSPYEGFLLLAAIHFHDVGNVLGREGHEKRIGQIMASPEVAKRLGDATEGLFIRRIASVHGGKTEDGSKDTISTLLERDELFGQTIRPRFLSALLRFADELADDRTRASRFRLADGSLPPFSELFHAYSHALYSVRIDHDAVHLSYEITPATGTRTYKKTTRTSDGAKPDVEVFLLDEIYARTQKMHQERMYCMRFWPSECRVLEKIEVTITACLVPPESGYPIKEERITFTLREEGYPTGPADDANCTLCLGTSPERPTGEMLKGRLEEACRSLTERSHG